MNKKTKVTVIFGGKSSEHEVSRVSAVSVIENLNKDKYDINMIGITRDGKWLRYDGPVENLPSGEWEKIASAGSKLLGDSEGAISLPAQNILSDSPDVIFPVLHGCNGEDGTIQGLFELAGIPYVGCGILGSALGMDKAYSKIIFEKEGIPQGKYVVINRHELDPRMNEIVAEVEKVLEYPCFIKPSNAGSSVGVSKASDRAGLETALKMAAEHDFRILAEEYIDGREIECAVLGNEDPQASVLGEVIPCNEFYDYEAKYVQEDSQIIIPASLPDETAKKIQEYAKKAFTALDCSGLSRVDFFVQKGTGQIYINEINTLPGFTKISMYPKLWAATGLSYDKLLDRLIELALERYKTRRRN